MKRKEHFKQLIEKVFGKTINGQKQANVQGM